MTKHSDRLKRYAELIGRWFRYDPSHPDTLAVVKVLERRGKLVVDRDHARARIVEPNIEDIECDWTNNR